LLPCFNGFFEPKKYLLFGFQHFVKMVVAADEFFFNPQLTIIKNYIIFG